MAKITRASRKQRLDPKTAKMKVMPVNAAWTIATQASLLAVLSQGGSVQAACDEADIARSTFYKRMREDDDFKAEVEDAIDAGTDRMEDEAHRRGTKGYRRPIYQGGELVGYERMYSDALLMKTLSGRRPEKWNTNRMELTGKDRTPLNPNKALSDEELESELKKRGLPTRIFK